MLVSAAGVAGAPLLTNLPHLTPDAKAAAEVKAANKENADCDNPKCKGCQVCTILFSNCLFLNNRVCWCEQAREELA
jgi:hypothetical protein